MVSFSLGLVLVAAGGAANAAEGILGNALAKTVASIEQRTGGRVGVSVTVVDSGDTWSYRGDERFPMASTFKAFSCGHLFSLADSKAVDLNKRIRIEKNDLQTYSPITQDKVGGNGMSLFDLCTATTSMSDNTAANLVLQNTEGPAGFTRFMRSLGDDTTRLDRYEPELNDVGPGDVRDTTSPRAAETSLRELLLGERLSADSREQLRAWLMNNQVGGPLLRASLPDGWQIADRTGSGGYGSRGVIAVIWPVRDDASRSGPVVVAVYLTGTTLSLEERNQMIAEVGAAMVQDLTR